MISIKQTEVFLKWREALKDTKIKAAIAARIFRLANGLAGDIKPVGEGVSELRIHYGAGYRVYLKKQGDEIIILLCGGIKKTQKRDIEIAKELAKNWKEQI